MGGMLSTRFFAPLAAAVLYAGPATAAMLGEPVHREGLQITPLAESGGSMDRAPGGMVQGPDALFLVADIRADKDEPHGFAEHSFIPYLSISYTLTKDGASTFKQTGLLYPVASKAGPRYAAGAQLAGPGSYHLSYIVSPPASHGLLRQTDKAGGVPDWWKPISASWTFAYPLKAKD